MNKKWKESLIFISRAQYNKHLMTWRCLL